MSEYRVRLEKECHVFSAAHFITFQDDVCERLHGHNYGVVVDVTGPLDANQYVIDFIALRDELKKITDALDHHVLLPTSHPLIRVTATAAEVEAVFTGDGRRWIFPLGDCVLLPIANTTAELLARYIAERLAAAIGSLQAQPPTRLEVAVDENHGQWGICVL